MYKLVFLLCAIYGVHNIQASSAHDDTWGYASDDSWSDDSEDSKVHSLKSRSIAPDLNTSPSLARKNQTMMIVSFDLPEGCVKTPTANIICGMITIEAQTFKYRIFLKNHNIDENKISILIKNSHMYVIFPSKTGIAITKNDIQIHDSYADEKFIKENKDILESKSKSKKK